MIRLFSRLSQGAPVFLDARPSDASAISAIHGLSFQRGWGEDEVHRLLVEKNVVAHRALSGRKLIGFILSRLAAGEAEILSIAVAPAWRGRRLSRQLLDLHLRALAGRGTRAVFLEVDEHNAAAVRLYRRAGFRDVGQRSSYYQGGANALVLRRDLG
jgi:ribosomal-protein-alanine N-acetyltransferase